MDHGRGLTRTITALASAGVLVALVGCGATDTPPSTPLPGTDQVVEPTGTPLLPVRHQTEPPTDPELIGFVDMSGQLVVEPSYLDFAVCPGADGEVFVVAQGAEQVDVLDSAGTVVGSAPGQLSGCGPIPGYARLFSLDWQRLAVTLPDAAVSDLGHADGVDHHRFAEYTTGDEPRLVLVDRDGLRVPTQAGAVRYELGATAEVYPSGEWPVPAGQHPQEGSHGGYIDQSGRWVAPPTFTTVYPFAHGYAAVADQTGFYFVDTTLSQVSVTYTDIQPIWNAGPIFAQIIGYHVALDGDVWDSDYAGLVTPDLKVVADPATSQVTCLWVDDLSWACLVDDDTGTWLVTLPDGARSQLPDGLRVALSAHLVTNDKGTQVYSTVTNQTFDVPPGFVATSGHGGAFVVCESANGLLVLDSTGARTRFDTVGEVVTTTDGKTYYWVTSGDQQGYVDATGTWLYSEH
ncbi:MAG: WG repeat-containing protein [Micrococcales bacterium]|nr:WG repeat-containing protein [Micrococcales bacterium]